MAFQPITHLSGKSPGDGGEHLHAYNKVWAGTGRGDLQSLDRV